MVGPKIKNYFLTLGLMKIMVDEILAHYFKDSGYADVEIYKTPLGYRIVIYAEHPGRLIGRGGSVLRKIAAVLQARAGLENVSITVSPVVNPDLNARVVAFRIARLLERGIPYRRLMLFTLRRVMEAGALGCEIVISGKLRGERASFEKLRAGKVYKAGEIVDHIVDRAVAHALLKPGVYGVEVIIVRPTTQLPDQIAMRELPPTEIDKIKEEVKGLLEAE
ncbi:MAG: 30S ribosomal protein S3 [Desulfurococcaceae archaeon]|jgi:small subunit ribosomal protein S3|nr:30S ribosomal protein S3 [Desulfurococcaceae archaeon]